MPILTWSSKFSIGINAVNDEHHKLFDDLNELQEAVENGEDPSRIGQVVHQLADRTRVHFSSEEAMMEHTKYAGLALHRLKHQHLMEQAEAFAARVDRGGYTLNNHSLNFLADWLTTHIVNEDRFFGRWLNEHGKS